MNSSKKDLHGLPFTLLTIFWIAQAVSLFGDRLNNFSIMALINRFAEDPGQTLSRFYFAMYLPIFILAPLIGVLLEKLDKRWVLVVTDLLRGAIVILIPPLFMLSHSFLPVMAAAFLLTTGNLFFLPAKSALIPELVPPDRLVRTNSILWAAGIVGVIGGFLGGGLIFDYVSWPVCFYLDGATYMLSASLLTVIALKSIRREQNAVTPIDHTALPKAIREGLSEIRRSPGITAPLGIQSLIFFGTGGFSVLAIVLIKNLSAPGSSMGLSATGISIGAGMGVGSIIANRINPSARITFETILFAVLFAATAAVAYGGSLAAVMIGSFAAGLSVSPLIIIAESELQERISISLRGRIFSFREIITRCLFLISAFLFSSLSKHIDRAALLTFLGLFLACTGVVWTRFFKRYSNG